MALSARLAARRLAPLARRGYASAALAEPLPGLPQFGAQPAPVADAKTTKLRNGVLVASQDVDAPTGTVAVVINAGSRHETPANSGVSQVLRSAAFLSTPSSTAFRTARLMESVGANLAATSTRENITYSAQFLRDHTDTVVSTVFDSVVAQELHPWEVKEATARAKIAAQLEAADAAFATVEDLHRAAFRRGLGNAFAVDAVQIGSISADHVADFLNAALVPSRVSIVSSGIPHEQLVALAETFFGGLAGEAAPTAASKYVGHSEVRTAQRIGSTHLAFGFQGSILADSVTGAVLAKLVAGTHAVKYSPSAQGSPVATAAAEAAKNPVSVAGLSASYSDAGVVGVHIVTSPEDAAPVGKAAYAAIKGVLSGSFTEADLNRAKNQVKVDILSASRSEDIHRQASEAAALASVSTAQALADRVDKLTAADVKKAAQAAGASAPVFVTRGNINAAPYFDEL